MDSTKLVSKKPFVDPLSILWELIEYNFRLNWVFDPKDGWLEFCWLPEDW